jgi:hypothetical protein
MVQTFTVDVVLALKLNEMAEALKAVHTIVTTKELAILILLPIVNCVAVFP